MTVADQLLDRDWTALRRLFPVVDNCIYLNNCSAAPLPLPVVEAMHEHGLRYSAEGRYFDELARVEQVRVKAAKLLGADPTEMALVQNTVTGINIVAQGLDWKSGDNVVVPGVEFPANYYPWYGLHDRGVTVKLVPEDGAGRVSGEALMAAIDGRTRVLAISAVQFTNGFRSDLEALGKACRARDVLLSVDAIQQLGCIPIDVQREHIDFLHAGSHKWLFGPVGTGVFYCRAPLLEQLKVATVGYNSMVRRETFLPYGWEPWPDARRFEPGVLNHAGFIGLGAALDLLLGIGIDAVERRVRDLTDHLIAGLEARECTVLSPLGAGERSGIVLFKSPSTDSRQLVKRFEANRIITVERSGGVRVGPAFYNDLNEIDSLLALLP